MSAWPSVPVATITTKVGSGATPRGGSEAYCAEGTPLIRSQNVRMEGFDWKGLAFIDGGQAESLASVAVEENDVLLNITGASIGRVTMAPKEMHGARVNQHVCIIRTVPEKCHPAFLRWHLASPATQRKIMGDQYGMTRQALTKAQILAFDVPLPPLDEQLRVVTKLDALFERSRRAKAALDAVPPLLDKLRQSILAAAFRGDLTRDWRAKNPDVEPASKLLERIRIERRRRWEEAELEKMRAKGKEPKDDKWKSKYVEPEPVDTTGLPELPEGWVWASVEEVGTTSTGKTPPTKTRKYFGGSFPFAKPSDLDRGWVNQTRDHLSDEGAVLVGTLPAGAVLVTCIGATIGKTGIAAVPCSTNQQINALVVSAMVMRPEWAYCMFCSPWGQRQIIGNSSSTTLPILNRGRFDRIPIPVPPLPEQDAASTLVGRTERAFKADMASAIGKLRTLEQAILGLAFAGDLC